MVSNTENADDHILQRSGCELLILGNLLVAFLELFNFSPTPQQLKSFDPVLKKKTVTLYLDSLELDMKTILMGLFNEKYFKKISYSKYETINSET